MNIIEEKNSVTIKGIKDFDPVHIFECGQSFRWNYDGTGYVGVVQDKVVRIIYNDGTLHIENTTLDDYHNLWHHYLDLGRDYGLIKKQFLKDPVLKEAVVHGYGVRILNQDPWETLISFIISANNNIGRIKNIIERLCEKHGEPIIWDTKIFYAFPEPEKLANASLEDLKLCGCGYRADYIKETAASILSGRVLIHGLKDMSYDKARDMLLTLKGVGPKVADCILLFGLEKAEAFPVDVWVKRIMEYFYADSPIPIKDIKKIAEEKFGLYAGIAQQYLFYYAREKKIGK